jgi:hypothetical protein
MCIDGFIYSRGLTRLTAGWFIDMEVNDGGLIGSILGGDDEGGDGMGYHSGQAAFSESDKKKKKVSDVQTKGVLHLPGKEGCIGGIGINLE